MSDEIIYIPIDDRPCTMNYPGMVAPIVNHEIIIPPKEFLGTAKTPAKPGIIINWLKEKLKEKPKIKNIIFSADMIAYGGLVASRKNSVDFKYAKKYLDDFFKVLAGFHGNKYCFNTLMRLAPSSFSERDFCKSSQIINSSRDLYNKFHETKFKNILNFYRKIIKDHLTPEIKSYIKTRERNLKLNLDLINRTQTGDVKCLFISMDDTKPQTLNEIEASFLKKKSTPSTFICPGTDEAALLLVARSILYKYPSKIKIFPSYFPEKGKNVLTAYEDRSIGSLFKGYIEIIGAIEAPSEKDADFVMLFNCPYNRQEEANSEHIQPFNIKNCHRDLIEKITKLLRENTKFAIADLKYANGADISLMELLKENKFLHTPIGYAAWNTAGNTLGTVLVHSIFRFISLKDELNTDNAHYRFLLDRYLDDWAYQAVIRPRITGFLSGDDRYYIKNPNKLKEIEAIIQKEIKVFIKNNLSDYLNESSLNKLIYKANLPWKRIFEIGLSYDV